MTSASNLKKWGKEEQMKPQIRRRKEIIKIRVEINGTEKKETIENQGNQKLILWGAL